MPRSVAAEHLLRSNGLPRLTCSVSGTRVLIRPRGIPSAEDDPTIEFDVRDLLHDADAMDLLFRNRPTVGGRLAGRKNFSNVKRIGGMYRWKSGGLVGRGFTTPVEAAEDFAEFKTNPITAEAILRIGGFESLAALQQHLGGIEEFAAYIEEHRTGPAEVVFVEERTREQRDAELRRNAVVLD